STTSRTHAPQARRRCGLRSWRSRPVKSTTAWPSASKSSPAQVFSVPAAETETMPGVFAQIGMEYGHKYGGVSFELFAKISEKNHAHSTLNPLAAYQKKFTLDQIMNDVMIAYP